MKRTYFGPLTSFVIAVSEALSSVFDIVWKFASRYGPTSFCFKRMESTMDGAKVFCAVVLRWCSIVYVVRYSAVHRSDG